MLRPPINGSLTSPLCSESSSACCLLCVVECCSGIVCFRHVRLPCPKNVDVSGSFFDLEAGELQGLQACGVQLDNPRSSLSSVTAL